MCGVLCPAAVSHCSLFTTSVRISEQLTGARFRFLIDEGCSTGVLECEGVAHQNTALNPASERSKKEEED